MGFRGVIKAAIVLSTMTNPTAASSFGKEEETVAAFEWFCIETAQNPQRIESLFSQIGIEPMEAHKAQPFIAPKQGKVWLLMGSYTPMVVSMTNDSICTIQSSYADGPSTLQILLDNFELRKISEDDEGTQTLSVYTLTYKSEFHLVSVMTSKLHSIGGINISLFPADLVRKEGF
jgi:hypothetical protein